MTFIIIYFKTHFIPYDKAEFSVSLLHCHMIPQKIGFGAHEIFIIHIFSVENSCDACYFVETDSKGL